MSNICGNRRVLSMDTEFGISRVKCIYYNISVVRNMDLTQDIAGGG